MTSIGVCEARTHLSRLLDRVEQGETLTITRHGCPVARLGPIEADDQVRAARAVAELRAIRRRVKRAPIEELIATVHEGHRH